MSGTEERRAVVVGALQHTIDAVEAWRVFDDARLAVERGRPGWSGTYLEVVGAELGKGGPGFLLAHEPDGPWLAVCPLDLASWEAVELPACPWAERQRWHIACGLRGHLDGNGVWNLEGVEVV